MLSYDALEVGSEIPPLTSKPISRHTLALYCGASGDHNPIHVDLDFAKAFGMPDVFAHGMLSMAYLGRMLTAWDAAIDPPKLQGALHLDHPVGRRDHLFRQGGREVRSEWRETTET